MLGEVLRRSRELGFLGPGAVDDHIVHAESFLGLLGEGERVLDLGSGGGLPGLVIAARRPDVELTLLDANERRVAFLREAVRELRAGDRSRGPGKDVETSGPAVTVLLGRAEDLAHRSELREAFDVVVARSFGAPAVTAECAVGFLLPAGRALVSEPPSTDEGRWPAVGLARLDLEPGARHPLPAATVQELLRVGGSIEGLPRSVGIPARRPFF